MRPPMTVFLCALMAPGCGKQRVPPPPPPAAQTASAVSLEPTSDADPNRMPRLEGWRLLAEARLSQAGPHRGLLQRTHVNQIAAAALDRGATSPWPDGSRMVKESLTPRGERVAMTGLSKVAGEWLWITGDGKGRITGRYKGSASGACEACHYTQAWRFDGSFAPVTAGKATLEPPPAPDKPGPDKKSP